MSSCISDKFCLRCFMIKLFSCLPWTVTSLFLFKSKSKKKKEKTMTNEKEIVDLSPFLSSFSAFLYKMAAMSEQYFNGNEPKSHFKINLYIYQLTQMSLCEGGVGSNSREGQMGE